MAQPKLNDLLARFLKNQAAAQDAGLGIATSGEVVPFEASPAQPVDPKAAWDAATAVLSFVDSKNGAKAPPHWSQLVATHEPEVALPFCLGNFPQLMRNFHAILHKAKLSELRPGSARTSNQPGLADWANQVAAKAQFPDVLVAAACLRLANDFDAAEKILRNVETTTPKAWLAASRNEQASLAWYQGRAEDALRLWEAERASVPVLFNRGMAALFRDRPSDAVQPLTKAVSQLPETNSWHHLGRLYLVLAQGRA